MLSRRDIIEKLTQAKPSLSRKYNLRAMALFGSYSRDQATAQSDVDIAVDVDGNIGIRFVDLAEELENILHSKVDLVSLKAIKPKYLSAIKSQLIYV